MCLFVPLIISCAKWYKMDCILASVYEVVFQPHPCQFQSIIIVPPLTHWNPGFSNLCKKCWLSSGCPAGLWAIPIAGVFKFQQEVIQKLLLALDISCISRTLFLPMKRRGYFVYNTASIKL